ncbi:hypothetical protein F4808DRAFT_471302 [Astrocystis sublimbata]|nr:hypothetical protein F4808DRAFT_471302 [Astrocystis sublimbata]
MDDPVAVIGFGIRFPGEAVNEGAFWEIIEEGRSTMTDVPASRYNINGFYDQNRSNGNSLSCRGGHFVTGDISAFDAPFFAMSSAEAKSMDPQLRLMLETTYHALENAGLKPEDIQGSATSVYVGNLTADYSSLFADDEEIRAAYQATGMSGAMLSNRISWFYDLRGPSMTLDTACSSSLVGLHLACQSIIQGETEMGLVGGVRLQLNPTMMTLPLARQNFLSPDSLCYSFDERANGYSRGEGIGMIIKKRLSRAIEDGNTIRAVIRGTSSNQDGRTPVISQPSPEAQAELIRKAYEVAGLDFRGTQYFEAHGTGTPVGDPIEAEGISRVFSTHLTRESPMYIGSVKANIGHLESTAGVAGVIKAVLALEHGIIPPNALLKRLNPQIRAEEWNLKFPTTAVPWPSDGQRRASVNSFGVGGANAHVVLDDALHYLQSRGLKGSHNTKIVHKKGSQAASTNTVSEFNTTLVVVNRTTAHESTNGIEVCSHTHAIDLKQTSLFLPLSAADEGGILRVAASLENHLRQRDTVTATYLRDVAFTLSEKRAWLPWKAYVVGSDGNEVMESLSSLPVQPIRMSQAPEINFVFTGQGAQWANMGFELIERYPIFRESMVFAQECLRSFGADWFLLDELREAAHSTKIDSPQLAQPVCTAIQIALVDLLATLGIEPHAVVGHSSGEIAAAYAMGALSRASALRVAYYWGQVAMISMNTSIEKGAMLAVALSEADLKPHITAVVGDGSPEALSYGCVNSPQNTTITGIESYIDALSARLKARKVFNRKLTVPVAYHSSQMLEVADSYQAALIESLQASVSNQCTSSVKMVSSVTGEVVTREILQNPEYWIENLVSKVRFSEALERMLALSSAGNEGTQSYLKTLTYLVEVGPHSALERPIRETLEGSNNFVYGTALRREVSPILTLQNLVGELYSHNHPVKIDELNKCRWVQSCPKMVLDLPLYPFNNARTYWLESRLSQNRRTRESPRHDFLGNPSADWNPSRPKWRFTIRASDLPWIVDHKVDDIVLYPGTGFLVMVLEAVRSLTVSAPDIVGIRFRDVRIYNALVIPMDEDGIETQLHMSTHSSFLGQCLNIWDFNIYSVTGGDWKLHCSGQVAGELSDATDRVSEKPRSPAGDSFEAFESQQPAIDSGHFYQLLHQRGYHFGSNFKTLESIRVTRHEEAMGTVQLAHSQGQVLRGEVSEHLVHPAVLDSLFHVMMATQYNSKSLPRVVPTYLSEVIVFFGELEDHSMKTMLLHGKVNESNASGIRGNITAVSSTTGLPVVVMRGCKFATLPETEWKAMPSESTSLFHRMHWKPDIGLLSRSQLEHRFRVEIPDTTNDGGDLKAEIVCRYFILKAFRDTTRDCWSTKPHMIKYIQWADNFNDDQERSTAALIDTEWPEFQDVAGRSALIDDWSKGASWREKVVMFCEHLIQILREEIDPLDLLFNQGIAESIYRSPLLAATSRRIAAYVDLLAHKHSGMKILEVGAGTGSTTSLVMEALTRRGGEPGTSPRFDQYDFTDISPSFFAQGQERFVRHANRMKFKVLDLERDPVDQGFEAESYDLIIAAAVVHATGNINRTLKQVWKLLKPGGRLILSEPTNKLMAATSGIFGVLPGWWLATEPFRTGGPLLSPTEWNEAVQGAGFNELQVSLSDNAAHKHMTSLLSTSLPSPYSLKSALKSAILIQSPEQLDFAKAVEVELSTDRVMSCEVITMNSIVDIMSQYDYCVSLVEFEKPSLSHLGEVRFTNLQHLMRKFKNIIWVTSRCGTRPTSPELVMMSGFAKSLMREDPSRNLIYLNVNSIEYATDTITRVVRYVSEVPVHLAETDLMEEDGVVYIPRVVEATKINRLLDSTLYNQTPQPIDVNGNIKDAIELRFIPGRLNALHFVPTSLPLRPSQEDEGVLISVKATGISNRDVMVFMNQLQTDELGCEVAGVVVKAGLHSGFTAGDRVCAFVPSGGFRSYVCARKSQVLAIPSEMSFTQASTIPLTFATAQYALGYVARLRAGESILIHAAAGGVGQAAIQIAQRIGAVIYATVGTPEKKSLIVERYGIVAGHCFSSRHVAFAEQLMRETADRGVDVVLNSLSGPALTETWRCMAPFGRLVNIEKRGVLAARNLPIDQFQQNISYSSVDMTMVGKLNDGLMNDIKGEIQALLNDRSSKLAPPHPVTVFKLSELESALRWIQTGQHAGKAVVTWELADTIQMIPKSLLDYKFSSTSTYVITGGLGGIGRNLAVWMASLGARHLVLLSRSGVKSDTAKEVVAKLKKDGVEVYAPACDVSRAEEVGKVTACVKATMPPIKGCIHGALVVVNRLFPDFSYQEFQDNLDPKIKGTWNLHNYLPARLDFFVMLSSIAGVNGAASQSPYSAASIFEDAFARFRHAQGQHCVSLDLGVVRDVGYVAERVDVARFLALSMTDHKSLTEGELHFMLKYACSPSLSSTMTSPWDSQIIGALTTPAFIRHRGVVEDHGWMRMPVFCHLYQMEREMKTQDRAATIAQSNSVETQLTGTKTLTEAAEVVTRALASRLARALAVTVKDIDVRKPPFTYGVDSLVAVELIFWFSNEVRADIPVIQILGNQTIAQLGSFAAAVSGHVPASVRSKMSGTE